MVVPATWITLVFAEAFIVRGAVVSTFGCLVLEDEIRAVTLEIPIQAAAQTIIFAERLACPINLEMQARFGRVLLAFVAMWLKFEASLAFPWDAGSCPGNRQDFAEGGDRHS